MTNPTDEDVLFEAIADQFFAELKGYENALANIAVNGPDGSQLDNQLSITSCAFVLAVMAHRKEIIKRDQP